MHHLIKTINWCKLQIEKPKLSIEERDRRMLKKLDNLNLLEDWILEFTEKLLLNRKRLLVLVNY
jgi:hypothetical protein